MKTKKQVAVFEGKKKLNNEELQHIWGGPDTNPVPTPPKGGNG